MEKTSNIINNKIISKEEFQSEFINNQSSFFNHYYIKLIDNIIIESYTPKESIVTFDIKFDENSSNPMNITHGGTIAILIHNMTSIFIYNFTKKLYSLKDLSINYMQQVELNLNVKVIMKFYKLGDSTIFANVEIYQKNKLCVTSVLIKNKIEAKF